MSGPYGTAGLAASLVTALPAASAELGALPAEPQAVPESPWLLRFPLRSPTLPPATHTNVYVLGDRDLFIVDPGTPDVEELTRLLKLVAALRAQGRRILGILLTHHHYDHASGVPFLRAELGVPLWAHAETAHRVAAAFGIATDQLVAEGDLLPVGPVGLRALHTPGHAPGHLCFHDEKTGELIAGDMVASVGTILIHPDDDGDMQLYLASLRRLQSKNARRLWPAHGAAIEDPAALLSFYLTHRQQREDKVVAALKSSPGTLRQLVAAVYADTPAALHGLAMGSLLAHLRKLQAEERATVDDLEVWHSVATSGSKPSTVR